jgi:hypothetical protein
MLPEAYELTKALGTLGMFGHRLLRATRAGDARAAARHRADLDRQARVVAALSEKRDRRRPGPGRPGRLPGGLEPFLRSALEYAAARSEAERASFFALLAEIYTTGDAGGGGDG